jgi:hypothetical protein
MNSLDPLYAKIADEWMRTIIADFGTDHWYQLDGYFDGGTAPWMQERMHAADLVDSSAAAVSAAEADAESDALLLLPACVWGAVTPDTYSAKCPDHGCTGFSTVAAAQAACVAEPSCLAVTCNTDQKANMCQLRAGAKLIKSPVHTEESYLITNAKQCRPPPPPPPPPLPIGDNPSWTARGVAVRARSPF